MKIRLADFLVEHLLKKGITDTFMVTGGGAMHINDALGHHDKMHKIFNHHEQACSYAAEGYARVKNKLCLVSVTTGPGGTNAISGVYGAWTDSIPMLVISGQVKRETCMYNYKIKLRILGDQEVDIISAVKSMTKYAVLVNEPNDILYHLDKAIYLATTGRPGPVWIDIPVDVQGAIIDTNKLKKFNPSELKSEYKHYKGEHFKEIIGLIKKSKRPVIYVGDGIHLSNSEDFLIKFAEKYDIPVVTPWGSHDLIWDDHKLFAGRPGNMGNRAGNFNVQNSDLLLILGCRCGIRQISYNYKTFAKNAYKIMVDIDNNELHKPTLHVDMALNTDVKEFLKYFITKDKNNVYSHSDWAKYAHKLVTKYDACLPQYYKKKKPLNPYVFFNEMFRKYLKKNDVIVTGNGAAAFMSQQVAYIQKGQRYFTNSGSASMGYGFPAAIGCSVANNNNRVICIDGDGSFQMNIQEIQTAIYNKMNIKIIYINNNGYSSIMQTQTNLFKPPLFGVGFNSSGLSFPDMSKLAPAYGLPYFIIDSQNNINILNKVLNINGTVFIEIVVDSKQFFSPKLASKKLPNGKMISPELDDMWPFLNRKEYLNNKKVLN